LSADPEVELAEPNYLRWASSSVPNDALFPQLWGLRNTGQSVNGVIGTSGDDIEFVNAWTMARTSSVPAVVAVIDTGVDYTHPDLAPSMWTNPGETPANSVDDDGNGYVDDVYGYDFAAGTANPLDSGLHGTHVSGTIAAAGDNLLGIIGVNYQARIMALKASSDGASFTSAAVIEAVQYATMMKNRGVNIVAINASFGGGGSSSTERAAIQAAGNAGIIFCAAAGNSGLNRDVTPDYPASYRLANMIVVTASDQNDALASFSDYGATTVDLAAPGVNILSTVRTVTSAYVAQASTTYSASELTFSGYTTGITATIYDCGLGYPTNFPPAVRNNIALISRGTLYFSEKVANAMAAGARAAIIYNNVSGTYLGTLQYASNWIPTLSLSQADGQTLLSLLPATGTVVNAVSPSQSYQALDGTSMAAPHVAGAVAFAAMNFPAETVSQRIQRVLANVDTVAGLQGKVVTGGRLNLLRIVDTDRNGLPDWWEQTYFNRLLGKDATADADHDGASNLAEWLAGTNPTNAASCLRLLAPSATATSGIVLHWPSVAGKTYRLERATNLLAGFNTVVRSNISATPPTNSEPDTAVLPDKARYYRVLVEP
jgi:subtilisin family serine protease